MTIPAYCGVSTDGQDTASRNAFGQRLECPPGSKAKAYKHDAYRTEVEHYLKAGINRTATTRRTPQQ